MNYQGLDHKLGIPDIKISGLQIWIHGRQFPEEADYWDGNWLRVTAHCGAPGADVWTSGSILTTFNIADWVSELDVMCQSVTGKAKLESVEPELVVVLEMTTLGNATMQVGITPDHVTQKHTFEFDVDQSYLPQLISECRKVLERYPVKGNPAS